MQELLRHCQLLPVMVCCVKIQGGHMLLIEPGDEVDKGELPVLGSIFQHRPELAEKYRTFLDSLSQNDLLPPRLLALCRMRIAQVHGCAANVDSAGLDAGISAEDEVALLAGDSSGFDASEQAALDVAELISFAHHQISDAQVARLNELLGHEGCVTLLTALSFIDVNCRLELVYGLES